MKMNKTMLLAMLFAGMTFGARAVEKTYTWTLPSDWEEQRSRLQVEVEGARVGEGVGVRYFAVQADGAARGVGEVGAPDLPVYNFMVTIPKNGSLKDVSFTAEWEEVGGEKVGGESRWTKDGILPTPVAQPVTAGEKVVYPEPGLEYDGVYPTMAAYALDGMLSGNKTLQPIRITPFKWDGTTKTLYVATRLDVKVVVVEKPTLKLTTSSVDTSEGEVLILSPHDFVDLWKGYAAFRKSTDAGKNFTFIVKDTSEIYADTTKYMTRAGDYALALHHYIESDFYDSSKCDKQYIILGASPAKTGTFNPNTMVPARYFFGDSGTSPHDYNQVGDMYFGCMERLNNGTIDPTVEVWDVGNDGYYWATNNASPYGFDNNKSVDWTMEIAVTRVPLLERSVETLNGNTIEVTASDMMNSFTNRIAWAESAAFRTEDRGNAYVGGTESEGDQKGGTDERYTGERYFFDGITNMFDPSRSGVCQSSEWGPRDRIYNISGKVQPTRSAVIRANKINTATMAEAYARSGDIANFYCHGDWRGYDNLSAPLAYQGGGFYAVYATSFSCMAGKYDTNGDGAGITNALCCGEAPIVAPVKENGALVTLTSARDGWSGGFGTLSMWLDELFLKALYGLATGTPMNMAQAGKYAHNTYAATSYGTTSAHGSVLGHAILCGDPLIKVFMMPDRTVLTGYSQKLSVSTASTKTFDISTDVAASQAAFSDANGETLTLSGTGKFRTTSSLTVTNVGELVWNVAGGAGRNGITFVDKRGNLTCSGTAERYFGPKLTNVGTISVPGGNVTLDFDTTACDFNKLEFINSTVDLDLLSRPNTLRTRKEGFIPSTQTIPVVNSALRLQTINIGGGNATLKDTPLFYVTNGVLKVENNPYWGTEYFVRPTYLSDATILGEYASFGLGRPDSSGYDLYVDGTSSIGGSTPIKVTGELRIHLEDAATTLTITNTLANGHDDATGSVTVSGAGKVVLGTSPTLTGGVTIESGAAIELPKIPLTSGGTITVESGAKLLLPEPSSSGIFEVWSGEDVKVVVEDGAMICKASAPNTAIAGRFNGGTFVPNDAVIYWKSASGTWQNSASAKTCWTNSAGTAVGFTNGQSVCFGPVSGSSSISVTASSVSTGYAEVTAPGSTYTFDGTLSPTLLTMGSDVYLPSSATLNARTVEVTEGASFHMHKQSKLNGIGSRTVKALKFSFSDARTSTERVAVQELRLFQGTTFFQLPAGTIIEDCAGNKIRVTGYAGGDNWAHSYEWITGSDGNETLRALIDGNLSGGNKWWASKSDAPTWFTITFPTAQSPITGYNLRTADHAPRNPVAWTVSVSEDGSTFTKERAQSGVNFSSTTTWMGGDGTAKAYDLMSDLRGVLHVKKGGTLISEGNARVDVTFDEGAILQIVGGDTSLFRPNDSTYYFLNLPEDGGVYVSAEGVSVSTGNEVLYGYSLTDAIIEQFTPADNVTLYVQNGQLYANVTDTKCGPFSATMSGSASWSDLAWTDRYGASVTWDSSLKHSTNATAIITVDSLASGGATLNLDVAATLGAIKLTGGSDETLTLSWSAAVVPTTIDLSEYAGKVILAPGSNLTSATEIIAGSDTVLPASCTATLTIGANMKATVTDGTYSGTWTLASTGELCFGGAMPSTLPYTSANPTGDGIIGYAGTFTTTAEKLEFKNNLSLRRIEPGASITGNKVHFGNANNSVESFEQTGGTIEAKYNGDGTDTSKAALILAHWGYNNPSIVTYNLLGGSMVSTNSTLYGVYFGADGRITMTIGGGTDEAVLDTTGIAQGNQDRTQASALTIAEHGILKLGVGGLYFRNDNATVTLAGGTIYAKDDTSIHLDNANGLQMLAGTISTLSAAEGKTLTVNAAFTGDGTLNVAGTGTVKLTNTTGFPSTVTVASGATLTLPTGYKLQDGKIVQEPEPTSPILVWEGNSATEDRAMTLAVEKGKAFTLIVRMTNTTSKVGYYLNQKISSGQSITPFCVAADTFTDFNTSANIPNNSLSFRERKQGGFRAEMGSRSGTESANWSDNVVGDNLNCIVSIYAAYSGTVAADGSVSDFVRLFFARLTDGTVTTLEQSTTPSFSISDALDTMNVKSDVGDVDFKVYLDHNQRDADGIKQIIEDIDPSEPEPTGMPRFTINFNVSQGSGSGSGYNYALGVLTTAVNTVVGEIPLDVWRQSTTYEYGNNVMNTTGVNYNNLVAYDLTGKTNAATTASVNVKCKETTNLSGKNGWSTAYPILDANLSMKAGAIDGDKSDGTLTFTNIPYDEYEIYVYFSRSTEKTDGNGELFQALSVKTNDQTAVFYKGENGATVTATDKTVRWGDPTVTTELGEGTNYLHITGLHGAKLELYTEGEKYCGMAAVQIVGTYSDEPKPETVTLAHQFDFNNRMTSQVGGATPKSTSASYVDGICDKAMTYVGNTGSWYADSGINGGDGNWSVLLVAKAPTTAGHVLFSMGGKSDANGFGVASAGDSGLKAFTWSNSGSGADIVTATTNDATSTYHLYVFAYDATNNKLKCSIDGADYTEGVAYTYTKNSKWQIGGIHGGSVGSYVNATTGSLDELRVYTGQLTTDDIAEIMLEFQYPYEATISGDTAFSEITGWTQNGVAKTLPADLTTIKISLKGTGKVTGLDQSPIALTLGEGVLCDVSSIFTSETAFSGYGIFLVDASAITADHTFGSSARWGIVGSNDTVSYAITANGDPFYTYGNVTLANATYATGDKYHLEVMSGKLTVQSATAPQRVVVLPANATIVLNNDYTLPHRVGSNQWSLGYFGEGTVEIGAGHTVDLGWIASAGKPTTSADQMIWTKHLHVGRNATAKFYSISNCLQGVAMDFLSRITVDQGGKVEIYQALNTNQRSSATKFVTFTSSADDTPFSLGATIDGTDFAATDITAQQFTHTGKFEMGYEGVFSNATRCASAGYDRLMVSSVADETYNQVTNALPSGGQFSVSFYGDISGLVVSDFLTVGGDPAIVLRTNEDMVQLAWKSGTATSATGVIAPKERGFHLYTVVKSDKGVALYYDGTLMGIDYTHTTGVTGAVTLGKGVLYRMFRVDAVHYSDSAVKELASMWPVFEESVTSVDEDRHALFEQMRVDSAWAAANLTAETADFLFNSEKKKADDELTGKSDDYEQKIEKYIDELEQLGANGLPLWESYLLGLDPNGKAKGPYVDNLEFVADAIDENATNVTVELSYANPARNSGINVTYRLGDTAVTDGRAEIKELSATNKTSRTMTPEAEVQPKLPNVILVLCDDLGYGDVGWTWQKKREEAGQIHIRTPYLDQMAAEGCILTAHYAAAPVCAPSRASILTGKHQGCCSLRDNCFDFPILEERTIGTVMREAGYTTYAIGKWGVGGGGESGLPQTAHPLDRGFDHYYGFLDHGAGHTYYHHDTLLNGAYMGIVEDRQPRTDTATGIYSTDLFAARIKKVIADSVKTNEVTGVRKPFFMYAAVNTVHGSGGDKLDASVPNKVNLQVPGRAYPAANGKSFGKDGGADWDWLQANREPIADRNTFIYDYAKGYGQSQSRYATTITRLDEAMHDIVQTLKDYGIDEETMIIFTSDNGPAAEYGASPSYFVSAGPFSGYKRSMKEGGSREPTFVRWPGHIPAGSVDDRPSMNHSWYNFLSKLTKSNVAPALDNDVYSEYYYSNSKIMVRIGDYVGVKESVTATSIDDIKLEIYNVVKDPSQSNNLASTDEGKALQSRMTALIKGYHQIWDRGNSWGTSDGGKQERRSYDPAK